MSTIKDYLKNLNENEDWVLCSHFYIGRFEEDTKHSKEDLEGFLSSNPNGISYYDYILMCGRDDFNDYDMGDTRTYTERWLMDSIGWTREDLTKKEWIQKDFGYGIKVWCIKLPEPRVLPEAMTLKEYIIDDLNGDLKILYEEALELENRIKAIKNMSDEEVVNEYK